MKLVPLVLAMSLASNVFAAGLLEPPQTLKDAQGNPETGLIDPFVHADDHAGDQNPAAEANGFLRTSLGEISTDFKILAIVIPANTNSPATAVLQLNGNTEPVVVRPGDTVRVEKHEDSYASARRGILRKKGEKEEKSLREKLGDYVFYLYIKSISPTHLEVYHNKKRPDDTIILNW